MAFKGKTTAPAEVEAWVPPAELMQRVEVLLQDVPGGEDDGMTAIAEQILSATSWEELNPGGGLPALLDVAGHDVRMERIEKRTSKIGGGTGIYLVVKGIDPETGEEFTASTSASGVMLRLIKAWSLGAFPILARVTLADVPTSRGFYPQILTIAAAGNAGR